MQKAPASNRSEGPEERQADVERKTSETSLRIKLNVDGTGKFSGSVGVPFFEHMLNLFTRHSLFDLEISGQGDTHIDAHHLVEDAGIVLARR